jgi:hypothetical protein
MVVPTELTNFEKVMFIELTVTGHVTVNFLLLISILKLSALKNFFYFNFYFVVHLDCCLGWIHHLHQSHPHLRKSRMC